MGAGASSAAPHDIALLGAVLDSLRTRNAELAVAIVSDIRSTFLVALPAARAEALMPVLEAAVESYLEARSANPETTHAEAKESALVVAGKVFASPKLKPVVGGAAAAVASSDPTTVLAPPPISGSSRSPLQPPGSDAVAVPPKTAAAVAVVPPSTAPIVAVPPSAAVAGTPSNAAVAASAAAAPNATPAAAPNASPSRSGSSMAERRRARIMGGGEPGGEPDALIPFLVASRSAYEEAEIGGGTVYTTEL